MRPSRLSISTIGLGLLLAIGACSDGGLEKNTAMPPPPEPAALPIADITGQEWIAASVTPSRANDFDWSGRGIGLQLDAAAGRAFGYGGCSRWFAGYTSSGPGRISFSGAGATRMACMDPPGVMEREQEFLDQLARIASYRVSEDHLYLETEDGSGGIVLIRDDG